MAQAVDGGSGKLQTSELNPLLMQQQVSFLVEQVREFSVENLDESLTPEHEQIQLCTGVNSYRFPTHQTLGELGETAAGLA